MAARLNLEQVLDLVQGEDSDQDQSFESDVDANEDEEKLANCLDSSDGGEGFNKSYFKENAIGVPTPLVQAAKPSDDPGEQPQRPEAAKLLSKMNFNAGSVLLKETRMWLTMIERRLGGRVSIRNPFYGEINRSIPYDIFAALMGVIRNADDKCFKEPSVYLSSNKKAEVISFTSLCSLQKFFSVLSGLSTKEVKKFFSRTLTSTARAGNKVKLLVEDTKDFGFLFKKSSGKLTVQFYYGEWNSHGFPRHNCTIRELSPAEV